MCEKGTRRRKCIEGQEERKEGLRRAGSGPGMEQLMKQDLFECFCSIIIR